MGSGRGRRRSSTSATDADKSMKLDLPTSAAQTGYKKAKCDFCDAAIP
ncbi:MAG TPA: hypothetical protein VHU80_15830 [Polyangiaceae bacterium]|nr:hypothetical protein [Polyangiaceae bacterium]